MPDRPGHVADPGVPGHAARVAGNVTAQATRPLLHAALVALPPGDRDVLLIAWEQLTYEEVSRALGIPVGTVRSRLHRARADAPDAGRHRRRGDVRGDHDQ